MQPCSHAVRPRAGATAHSRVQPPGSNLLPPRRALGEQLTPGELQPGDTVTTVYCPNGTPLRLKAKPFQTTGVGRRQPAEGWAARMGTVSLPMGSSKGGLRLRSTSGQALGSQTLGNLPCLRGVGPAAARCPAATGFISCGVKGAIHSLTRMSGEEPGLEPRLDGSWVPGTPRGYRKSFRKSEHTHFLLSALWIRHITVLRERMPL